jgi:hypothetical protein
VLVRELRAYHQRRRWQTFAPAAVTLAVNALLIALIDHPALRLVLALCAVLVVAGLWHNLRMHRRLADYRGVVDP